MLTKHNLCYNFLNKNQPKKLKLRLKNTIIDKTCASEAWILTNTEKANEHF
jgi:hypothetical protein